VGRYWVCLTWRFGVSCPAWAASVELVLLGACRPPMNRHTFGGTTHSLEAFAQRTDDSVASTASFLDVASSDIREQTGQ
jgi:hypothetical protein